MRKILALVLSASLLAAACGDDTDDATVVEEETTTTEAVEDTEAQEAEETDAEEQPQATGPITLETTAGQEVTIDAPAQRIVVLEWDFAEHLMALGVPPVGVADVAGFEQWLTTDLPDDVTDVGTRQEPGLESIAALEPDLIVGAEFRHAANLEQYEAIAPTVLFDEYPPPDAGGELDAMREALLTLGDAVGEPERAAEVLADLDAHLAEAAQRLEEAGLAGVEVAVAQGFSSEGSPQIRMFTDNARVIELLEQVGLENGWDGPPEEFGFNTVDAEGLTALGDVHFLYVAQPEDDIFADVLPENPIWSTLPFVQSGRVYSLGGDTWMWGGPQSAQVLVDRVVDQLTAAA